MTSRPNRSSGIIAALVGSAAALLVVLVVVLVTRGGGEPETTQAVATSTDDSVTTSGAADSTSPPTTATATTTTSAATTTTAPASTTTAATTTTVPAFNGDTSPKSGSMSGSPDPRLIDVRWAQREGFTRVVFDFGGDSGTPMWQVGYSPGPFTDIPGDPVPVSGTDFLYVVAFPGMRFDLSDPDNIVQTYNGPERIATNTNSVVEVVFVEDFEANLEWAIGVNGQKPFSVFTLENPTRLVIDIDD